MSAAEDAFAAMLAEANVPPWVREHRFHAVRRWRFDFAFPEFMVAIEVEGGTWAGGRHNTGRGYQGDLDKYNAAALAGWAVYRVTPSGIRRGSARRLVERIFDDARAWGRVGVE